MIYGEEFGFDVYQDFVVLIYLEGLLMYQVVEGLGIVVDKKFVGRNEEDQNFNVFSKVFFIC